MRDALARRHMGRVIRSFHTRFLASCLHRTAADAMTVQVSF